MRPVFTLLLVVVAACGSGHKETIPPSAEVVVTDVDGGTTVGTAAPNTKKAGPSRTEARPLSYRECRALAMHIVELLSFDAKVDPDAMREATYNPGSLVHCDQPLFSDEIFDCMLAAMAPLELMSCMKYGDPLKR